MTQLPEITVTVKHTVKRGDTLWGTARKAGKPLDELLELNPSITVPDMIFPGDVFVVHKETIKP